MQTVSHNLKTQIHVKYSHVTLTRIQLHVRRQNRCCTRSSYMYKELVLQVCMYITIQFIQRHVHVPRAGGSGRVGQLALLNNAAVSLGHSVLSIPGTGFVADSCIVKEFIGHVNNITVHTIFVHMYLRIRTAMGVNFMCFKFYCEQKINTKIQWLPIFKKANHHHVPQRGLQVNYYFENFSYQTQPALSEKI